MTADEKKGCAGCTVTILIVIVMGVAFLVWKNNSGRIPVERESEDGQKINLLDDRPTNEYASQVYDAELKGYEGMSIGQAFGLTFWKMKWAYLKEVDRKHGIEFKGLFPGNFYMHQLSGTFHRDDVFTCVFLLHEDGTVDLLGPKLIHTCQYGGRNEVLTPDMQKAFLNRIYGKAIKLLNE